MQGLPFVVAATIASGCGVQAEYIYAPKGATSWADARPVTTTAIPDEAPQGSVELSSFGITQLTPNDTSPIDALHVRMTITNKTDPTPWTVDTRDILLDLGHEGRSHAMLVNTDVNTLPMVTLDLGNRTTLDLYFPIPANATDESVLPTFDVVWQISISTRHIMSRTSFRAVEIEQPAAPPSAEVVLVAGWGPRWWFNTSHIRQPSMHVAVTRPPRWHYHPKPRPPVRDHRR